MITGLNLYIYTSIRKQFNIGTQNKFILKTIKTIKYEKRKTIWPGVGIIRIDELNYWFRLKISINLC